MATHDYVIANQGFPAFRSDLNDAFAAIVSNNSSATEPTTMFAHMIWVDTAANPSVLKIRNADNDAWITVGVLDQTGDTFILRPAAGSATVPAYSTTSDTNTGVYFPGADRVGITTGGSLRMEVNSDGDVVVSSGQNILVGTVLTGAGGLTLSATNNLSWSESTGAFATAFRQSGSAALCLNYGYQRSSTSNGWASSTSLTVGRSSIRVNNGPIQFYTDASSSVAIGTDITPTERMRITSDGEVLVGGTTALYDISGMLSIQRTDAAAYLNLYRNDTTITAGNAFGFINFFGNDTTSNTPTVHAQIYAIAGTHAAGDNPTDLVFSVTNDGTETAYEALRILYNGTLDSQDTYDNTQSGSTVVVTSGGLIGRTSSSIKYKKDVETLDADLVTNAITNLRPVWYRTKDAKGDDKETWSHIGLIAEEVHEVEPRLVRYRTEKVEFVDVEEQVTKTREVSPAVTDEEGNIVQEAVTEEYTETVTRKEKQKTPLETPEPEDVDYGRLAVLCLAKIQEQDKTIAALEARIAALENA